jgi:hypothetical protein
MAFTTDTANAILNAILKNTAMTLPSSLYVSLHTADPADSGANEIAVTRQSATFTTPSAKASTNTANIVFTNMPAVTVTYVGLWSASTSGTFWWGGALSASKVVNAGDTFQINASDLDVTLT